MEFYFDFHQNSQEENIDVATVGITAQQAKAIKRAYREIRERILTTIQDVPRVDLNIEPIDKVTFGARVAKQQGILHIAKRALHLEMPAHRVFYDPRARHVYTAILAELIRRITTPRLDSIAAQPSIFAARVSAP